jgi:hypothetical protein
MDDYIAKPFRRSNFLDILARYRGVLAEEEQDLSEDTQRREV